MPRKLTSDEVAKAGVRENHEQMDNGECRYRMMFGDGSGYIRVEAGTTGAWQNSHYHTGVRETTIVQRGFVIEVNLIKGSPEFRVLGPGESFTSKVGVHHNQYMAGGAVTHTVKFGDCSDPKDWHASPELDGRVKHLTEDDVFHRLGYGPDEVRKFKQDAFG